MFESKNTLNAIANLEGQFRRLRSDFDKEVGKRNKQIQIIQRSSLHLADLIDKHTETINLHVNDLNSQSKTVEAVRTAMLQLAAACGFEYFFENQPAKTVSGFKKAKKQKTN